ncbi:MAG: hypothetical protein IJG00_05990 [Clostridia bacterium]|nr:hypothetical protein [Clostridia bacterium]
MKKQILRIFSSIMCIFGVLTILSVDACRFKLKTRKGIEGKYYVMLHDKSKSDDNLLSTYLIVKDSKVLLWNNRYIDIRSKKILMLLQNLIIVGNPSDNDYYDNLEKRKEQDQDLYNYLKKRINK